MNPGKTIFAQLMDFLPTYQFQKCVEHYRGHYKVKSFSCWDQFLCLVFAQLTYRESLRDIEACLRAANTKLYHLGIRGRVYRNTLANANTVRDWRIYGEFAQVLVAQARQLYAHEDFGLELEQTVYVLVAIVKKRLNVQMRLYTILQILSVTLFEKIPSLQALSTTAYTDQKDNSCNQPNRFD